MGLYLFSIGVLCGIVGFRIGWRAGHRVVLPVMQGIAGMTAFLAGWTLEGPWHAVAAVAGWALGTTAASVPVFRRDAARTDELVLRSAPYRAEMTRWLVTERGPESTPVATTARHALELAAYLAAAVATANFAALVMGAILLNYMNAWVASLLRAAVRPWTVRLLAWNVWSVVRVAAYVVLGAAAAWPLMARLGWPWPWSAIRPLVVVGSAGVVLDLALKLALSRPCGRALAAAVDVEHLG